MIESRKERKASRKAGQNSRDRRRRARMATHDRNEKAFRAKVAMRTEQTMARATVIQRGRPSGIALTAKETAVMTICSQTGRSACCGSRVFRRTPTTKMIEQIMSAAIPTENESTFKTQTQEANKSTTDQGESQLSSSTVILIHLRGRNAASGLTLSTITRKRLLERRLETATTFLQEIRQKSKRGHELIFSGRTRTSARKGRRGGGGERRRRVIILCWEQRLPWKLRYRTTWLWNEQNVPRKDQEASRFHRHEFPFPLRQPHLATRNTWNGKKQEGETQMTNLSLSQPSR